MARSWVEVMPKGFGSRKRSWNPPSGLPCPEQVGPEGAMPGVGLLGAEGWGPQPG